MKNYLKGLILLGLTLILGGITIMKAGNRLRHANEEATQLRNESRGNNIRYKSLEVKFEKNRKNSHSMHAFSKEWEHYLKRSEDAPKILNEIVGLSFKNTVAVSEKSVQKTRLEGFEGIEETIRLNLKVIGKFERIYAWLGEVELAFPQVKITELELASENRNATLKLGLELPIVM